MSDPIDPVLPQHHATLLLAPILVSFQLQIALWGIAFATFARYMTSPRAVNDSIYSRLYVSLIMLLNTIVTGMIMASAVRKAVAQHRDSEWFAAAAVNDLDEAWSAISLPIGILTRAFLARRAFLFTRLSSRGYAWSFVALILLLSALEVFGAAAGRTKRADELARAPGRQSPSAWITAHAFSIAFFAGAAADIAISGTLAWQWIQLLRSGKWLSNNTKAALRGLVSFTLATASYTAVFAILAAIMWAAVPGTIWMIFATPFPGLYTLSLFTTLEYRAGLGSRKSIKSAPTSTQAGSGSDGWRPQRAGSSDGEGTVREEEAGATNLMREFGQRTESMTA